MREVSSQVLGEVATTLQLAGRGTQITQFEDGILQQVLDIGPLVRRGGALAGTDGMFGFQFATTHGGAGTQSFAFDPYTQTPGTSITNPWPVESAMQLYDAWAVGPFNITATATGVTTHARLDLVYAAARSKGVIGASGRQMIGFWSADGPSGFLAGANGDVLFKGVYRIPRGASLTLTTIATAAVGYSCKGAIALMPAGLGQDCAF